MSKREGNNGEFEQSWKSAFSGEEVTPPSSIWNEIDHSLTQTQLSSLQKKTALYKWTAAAAVVFALSLSAIALSFNYQEIATWLGIDPSGQSQEAVAQLEEENESPNAGNYAGFSILRSDFVTEPPNNKPEVNETQVLAQSRVNATVTAETRIFPRSTYPSQERVDQRNLAENHFGLNRYEDRNFTLSNPNIPRSHPIILKGKTADGLLAVIGPDPESFGVNGVVVFEVKRPILNAESKTRFWSGVDIASGYFNPNYGPGTYITPQDILTKDVGSREPIPELSENIRGGVSYSVGINFGMDLKDRWSLEVGALYSLLGARTFTNLILESDGFNNAVAYSSEIAGLESVANLVESELTKLSVDDIQINNTFQFISFPVQAGYKLLDKRFNVTLNAGLAANLYLGNRLRGQQNFSSFELEPGRRSPYRSLTLAAVTGFEIGYWIHRRVNLSFEPTYQKNLQSLTKNDAGFVANPSGVGVQVGFKYDF